MDENTDLQQEETDVLPTETPEVTAEETEEPILPLHEQKVFGVSRLSFWGIIFGYGGGLILCGIFGMITGIELKSTMLPSFLCAGIGYFIGAQITKKLQAQQAEQDTDTKNS